MHKKKFNQQTAIITGASSGMGKATAEQFSQHGINLLLTARNEEKLATLTQQLRKSNIQCEYLAGDITDEVHCEKVINYCLEKLGKPSVLVNNAGTIARGPLVEMTTEEWQYVMKLNVDSLYFMCKYTIPHLQQGSSIINVASTVSGLGCANLVSYCTSKGAVANFTRALAIELASQNITVNAVSPGAVDTPMLYSKQPQNITEEDVQDNNIASIPQGRIAQPEEIARSILFLAQEPHITGTILAVDGGYTAQ